MTRRAAVVAAALYLAAALLMTWPLARVITHEIAWDLGDPLFNSWVLLWTGGQVLAFLGGDWSALSRFWHGNIFHPERLTLAYSEHLFPQMVQALPVLAASDNAVLAYNLLFLSTFVLCGLGTFLFVRELTRNPVAAFVAGLAFAFAPYRMAQLSHLQVLSVQWMPLVLYAYRRHFETGRRAPLVWGSIAFVIQNLSCGYYLLFFAPFVGLYVIVEMSARGLLADWRVWRRWLLAGAAVLIATAPFLRPYFEVREGTSSVGVRDAGEIALFSADVHSLGTAAPHLWLWGDSIAAFPKAEGEGFPGFTILLLAVAAGLFGLRAAWRQRRGGPSPALPPWRQVAIGFVGLLLAAHLAATLSYLLTGGLNLPFDGAWVVHRDGGDTLVRTAVLLVLWWLVNPAIHRLSSGTPGSLVGFLWISVVIAVLFALGPIIVTAGHPVASGPYALLVNFVPGYDGVRVPARFFMLMALFLAVLSGYGLAAISRWWPRWTMPLAVVASALILLESWPGPFQTNVRLAAEGLQPTPRVLESGRSLPPIYNYLRDEVEPLIVIEFPFGAPAWDLFSVYYAGYHRRPLVNGYSGFFPESQQRNINVFRLVGRDPETAWRGLAGTGATHAVVHEDAFIDSQKGLYAQWLLSNGAAEIMTDGPMRLFRIR
jgi:hypothetical protein